MPPILTNIFGLIAFLVFVALPAYYINRYLIALTRPKESLPRFLAYVIISLASTAVLTTLVVIVLIKFVFTD